MVIDFLANVFVQSLEAAGQGNFASSLIAAYIVTVFALIIIDLKHKKADKEPRVFLSRHEVNLLISALPLAGGNLFSVLMIIATLQIMGLQSANPIMPVFWGLFLVLTIFTSKKEKQTRYFFEDNKRNTYAFTLGARLLGITYLALTAFNSYPNRPSMQLEERAISLILGLTFTFLPSKDYTQILESSNDEFNAILNWLATPKQIPTLVHQAIASLQKIAQLFALGLYVVFVLGLVSLLIILPIFFALGLPLPPLLILVAITLGVILPFTPYISKNKKKILGSIRIRIKK